MASSRGAGVRAFALASAAVVCAAAFTAWAYLAPAYASGETIVEVNQELTTRLALWLPLAVTALVWALLHHACRHDARWARAGATVIGWLLFACAVVSAASVGMFVLPVAMAVLIAARLTPVAAPRRA